MRQNRWKDKTTDQTRSKIEVTANSVQFLSPASQGVDNVNRQPANNTNNQNQNNMNVIEDPWNDGSQVNGKANSENFDSDDDIPF